MTDIERDAKLSLVRAQVGLVFRMIKPDSNSDARVSIPVSVSGIGSAISTKGKLYLTKETAKNLFCGFGTGQVNVVKNKENNFHRVLVSKKFLIDIEAFKDFKAEDFTILPQSPELSVSKIVFNLLLAYKEKTVFSETQFSQILAREFSCHDEDVAKIKI